MRPSNNQENKILLDRYQRAKLVCTKIQAHISSEPTLEYDQDQIDVFNESRLVMTFSTDLGVRGIICSFKLVIEGKASIEIL